MRKFIDAVSLMEKVISSRPGQPNSREARIYRLASARHLASLIARFNQLRGIIFPDRIEVWESYYATHVDYRRNFPVSDADILIIITDNRLDLSVNTSGEHNPLENEVAKKMMPGLRRTGMYEYEFDLPDTD